jgi:transcriptional regulator with XRE-family HTH domain
MKKEDRAALRTELYERAESEGIGLVEALRMMRKIAKKTQAEYAKMVGVSPRVLIDFERGAGNPTVKTLEKMLAPFNLELTVRRRRDAGERERERASPSTRRRRA